MTGSADLFAPRQTNTGLFVQLHERGFGVADIKRVQHLHSLAAQLFTGRYRKTERPFLCHAVGAASAAAAFTDDL